MEARALRYRKRGALVVLACLVGGGGVAVMAGKILRSKLKSLRQEQRRLCDAPHSKGLQQLPLKHKVAVDDVFAKRLVNILSICVPSMWSKEFFFVALQTCFLYSRTLLTERIAFIEGQAGQSVVSKDWSVFTSNLLSFASAAVPAAVVNSALKFMQTIISLSFQQRLTESLHHYYFRNRFYYLSSIFGDLPNPDQRITEDVAKFSSAISDLHSYTFKPVLDMILFTRSLAKTIGYKGQFILYGYFLFCSSLLRAISPPLALMATQEAALSGNFRNAHQRIVSHAEEIAFNDPPGGDTERTILNNYFCNWMLHCRISAFQKFIQQVADGYFVKYTASIIGLCVFAAPFYFSSKTDSLLSTGEYIRAMRLMMNTSKAVGQLVLVYKKVTSLAAFTSRVAELLDSVKELTNEHDCTKPGFCKKSEIVAATWKPPTVTFGDSIEFQSVTLFTPDGTLLVQELSFVVAPGHSVILMGPNGSGKSSLLRVLAGLWPLQSGMIQRPPPGDIFYLSQRPYIVRGTLREQICYPKAPLCLGNLQSEEEPNHVHLDDARMIQTLHVTDLGYLLDRGDGLDQFQNWEETLSGGEKQRLAVSRLLYHHPKFAVLDECTSAVSADGEEKLYRQLQMSGITMLSIAHRPGLKKFHSFIVHLDGGGHSSNGWTVNQLHN